MLFSVPTHPLEVAEGFWQRSLRGDVGVLLPVPINVIGIDVITAWDSCGGERGQELLGAAHNPVPIALLGPAGRGRGWHVHKALDKSPLWGDARISPSEPAKDRDGA